MRIKLLRKSSFLKGYNAQNNRELSEIYNLFSDLPITIYQIKSIGNPEEDVIKRQFYANELLLASKKSAKIIAKYDAYTST